MDIKANSKPAILPFPNLGKIFCNVGEHSTSHSAARLSRCVKRLCGGCPEIVSIGCAANGQEVAGIWIGTYSELSGHCAWFQNAGIQPFTEFTTDAFEIRVVKDLVVVVGANRRGVIQGVHELEDVIIKHQGVPFDFCRRAQPQLRWRLLHPRFSSAFDYTQADFDFISRSGANVALLQHDWLKEKTLFSFVECPEFPGVVSDDQLLQNRRRLRQYLNWCNLYELKAVIWLCELPCQGGPWVAEQERDAFLNLFPSEVLSDSGTYQGKVLCFRHPRVRQVYQGMIRRFLSDFPEIQMFLVFTLDSSGELCDPSSCTRHHGVEKISQYYEFLSFLIDETQKFQSEFYVLSVAWGWKFRSRSNFLLEQQKLPSSGGLATLPDGEAWSFDRKMTNDLREQRKVTREANQILLGYDIFLWGDDTIFPATELYEFPLGVAAKLRRWYSLGVDGVFDQWGTCEEHDSANARTLREMFLYPEQASVENAMAWARGLANELYGAEVGELIFSSWLAIEDAQKIQSDHTFYWHYLRPNWAKIVLGTPLTIEALSQVELSETEPDKFDGTTNYGPPGDAITTANIIGKALFEAADHFRRACETLERALSIAELEEKKGTQLEVSGEGSTRRRLSTCERIKKQLLTVRLQEGVQRESANFFAAFALAKALPLLADGVKINELRKFEAIRSSAGVTSPKVGQLLYEIGMNERIAGWFTERVAPAA